MGLAHRKINKKMYILVLVTAANKKEANLIAQQLVKERLAACVNIIDKIESIFFWQNKIEKAKENLLFIKSTKIKLPQIIKKVKSLHSYQVPEVIAFEIKKGEKKYLNWLDESIK